jgi:hypothetical protein
MNERIKELATESQPPYGNFDHQKFAELIIKDIVNVMSDQKTYNRCVYTTHDLDKAICVTQEIIKIINEHFGTKQ